MLPVFSFTEHFAALPDPRVERTRHHALHDLLFIALCAVLAGADGFGEIEAWGRAHEPWLRQHLELPNGIPSHDTFNRVFARLDPVAFGQCFLSWVTALQAAVRPAIGTPGTDPAAAREVIALDGKVVRRSFDRTRGQNPIHMVSAWALEQRLVLAQVKVDAKSNEITALPALLALLDVSGCVVTADALGCQKELARQIVAGKGDYVLAVKDNQPSLCADVQPFLDDLAAGHFPTVPCYTTHTFDADHGRHETRRYWLTGAVAWLRERQGPETWSGLASLGMVEARRRNGGPGTPETVERRYYISSLAATDAASVVTFARAVRGHWGIENSVHWVLDLAFREDECRVRTGHAPQNLATLRHLALNLLRQEKTTQVGMKAKRMKAAWDVRYLERVLNI